MSGEGKPTNDELEPTGDRDAVPEEIASETAYSVRVSPQEDETDVHPDRNQFERADTDRHELGDDPADAGHRENPTSLTFSLVPIQSMHAPCFFCGERGCEQVFMARLLPPLKTKAWAVHNECIFDHERLQELASEDK